MKLMILSVALMTILTGCGVEWFPGDATSTSVSITTATLADAPTGLSYSQTLAATGGTAPYHWTKAGTFPAGLNLSDGGLISGIPTDPTTIPITTPQYTFTVTVTDSATTPATATKSLSISTPITSKDLTGKVYAQIFNFDATRGVVVTITNTDSVVHTVQVVAADYDTTTDSEITGSAFNMTPVAVSAGASTTIANVPSTASTVNSWRIKSVTII